MATGTDFTQTTSHQASQGSTLVADTQTVIERRAPSFVMQLARLGSFHQSRLSFMRILTRRMQRESWTFSRPIFEIDGQGVGHAVYCAHGPERTYSLIAFAHDLPAEQRSDRVIATAWDATFTLFDGMPTQADINRLAQNVPLQEAGRVSESELSISRANRSVRLWEHVVSSLAKGQQPDQNQLSSVGYLMRTTAVYGSGKFGAADREVIAERPEFAAPFQMEMLSVFLTRCFSRDLVQHMATVRGGSHAATLDAAIAKTIGIGNSTGLGMAPFILNHPVLFNNWIMAREEAIARVRRVPKASQSEVELFLNLLRRSMLSAERWYSVHPQQVAKVQSLKNDLALLDAHLQAEGLDQDHPWDRLSRWAANALSLEGQECLASLLLEPYGDLVDELVDTMATDYNVGIHIDGVETLGELRTDLEDTYDWALAIDWQLQENNARVWYVSAEKLEPRLGERHEEPIEDYEQPLSPGRDAASLYQSIQGWPPETTVAEFLLRHPEHRHMVRRVQMARHAPYAEIRDNTISASLLPIDMLRCKLSFFGAIHFDPRSDRWVRICLYANAPYPEELAEENADHWPYPDTVEATACSTH